MINCQVSNEKVEEEVTFPVIAYLKESPDFIVLFTEETKGIVLKVPSVSFDSWKVGDYSAGFGSLTKTEMWCKLEGSVTLSNNP